ncbi:GDSL-type esterase/lipase family protein [Corynebacterium dentalis]|uniref:GDSL-type esterase/lipase family protein n=1 Tax=Corynebacterium dentalis TaxID=2014528 RepID=UPI002897ADEE|nr:GDSL-type esterase/lipase family protein [Corynebacterium dentalis]
MKRKISHLTIAAIAVIAPLAIAAPAATAAPGGTAVFVGDSIPSNPTPLSYLAGKTGSPLPGTHVNANGCGSDGQMPSAYGQAAGKQTFDYTCAGASVRSGGELVTTQLNHAAAAGKLNASTSEVVIMAGANDTYPHILNKVPLNQIETDLTNGFAKTINHAHRLAPNARVKLVGYSQISAPNGDVCVINLGDNTMPLGAIPAVRDSENILQRAGINAANRAGATFVDSKAISQGHDICAPANQRWIMGVVDTSPQPHNLIVHMTNAGLRALATNAAQK